MAGRPERMFVAAVLVRITLSGNLLPCGALAFLERIRIARHGFGFLDRLDFVFFAAADFESDALLRSASFRSTGMPCFLSTSANASSASSRMPAIRSRANCFSLSKVSSSKAINVGMCRESLRHTLGQDSERAGRNSSWSHQSD